MSRRRRHFDSLYPVKNGKKLKRLDPAGVNIYKGKKAFFYNGQPLRDDTGRPLYDDIERSTWRVIIISPGVEEIPPSAFCRCWHVKIVIMADTVKQINQRAFMECSKLSLIKFPKSLLYIGSYAFKACVKLEAIFIPESCREVGMVAFEGCKKLMVLNVSRHALLRIEFIADTALLRASPFTVNINGRYKENQHDEVLQWVRNINSDGDFALHRICASFDPCEDTILELVRVNAPGILQRRNKLGMTPMDYLSINPSSDVDIQKILNGHILGMMGELQL